MKAEIIDLGRTSFNATVEFKTTKELHKIIGSKLLSRNWHMEEITENEYAVVVGMRTVGKVKRIE